MKDALLVDLEAVYRRSVGATGSHAHAFVACVEAFQRLHPGLTWSGAALQVERLLERSRLDAQASERV
ncbi:MAG: hypothetical protein IRZ04_03575 [Rhodospirillales bacterium]|nr:hypothetical protein [Rhodospirillales bacterium]